MFRVINSRYDDLLGFVKAFPGVQPFMFDGEHCSVEHDDGTTDNFFVENDAYLAALDAFNNRNTNA